MALDVTGIQYILGNVQIGIVPAWIIGIIIVIIVAILINKPSGDKSKTVITMAPLSCLLMTMGFALHTAFILLIFIAFIIFTIMGTDFKEATIETSAQ